MNEEKPAVRFAEAGRADFVASLNHVSTVIAQLVAFGQAHSVKPEDLNALELIAAEAINNAVLHGAKEDASQRVVVEWWIEDDQFVLMVTDPSNFLPEEEKVTATLPDDPLSECGRGTFLLHELSEEVNHSLVEGRHRLRIVRRLTSPASPPETAEEMEATLGSMAEELSTAYENLSALFRLGEQLACSASFQAFLSSCLSELVELTQSDGAEIALWREEGEVLLTVGAHGALSGRLGHKESSDSKSIAVQAATKAKELSLDADEVAIWQNQDPLLCGHVFCIPMAFADKPVGALTLHRPSSGHYFASGQTQLARTFADFISIIATLEELQEQRAQEEANLREMRIAAEIQRRLLPTSFPTLEAFEVNGVCKGVGQVAGDYVDAIPVHEHSVLAIMADVMGKGIPAAMLGTVFRTALYARPNLYNQPAELMMSVARQLYHHIGPLDMFITVQFAYCNAADRTVTICSAGHCPAFLWTPSDEGKQLREAGVPLGILEIFDYEQATHAFPPGSRLALYTDGLYEVDDGNGTFLDVDGLQDAMTARRSCPLSSFIEEALYYVAEYSNHAPPSDDRSVVVVDSK